MLLEFGMSGATRGEKKEEEVEDKEYGGIVEREKIERRKEKQGGCGGK